ncbi:MAG TPA: tRNA (adenosine(37)-N6)-dimethylallyltransferase MiaA [Candidatus Limnocylindrales bacterium]|nr:tRNA (adenosine(37)-N6)-dimethylallyltransferase MiaA [Candidatus Limnocylindrales bacterium]
MTVLAILGPTASGKSALAIRAAQALGGEIVSADSRQVYRGLDVGTAKPTAAERALVPHHMLDVAEPSERYDAARYRREATAILADLASRGVRPVVVGGTGLYVRALLDGLDLDAVPADAGVRARLEEDAARLGGPALHARLAAADPAAAQRADPRNVRRVIRYLEIVERAGTVGGAQRRGERVPSVKIGLRPDRELLSARIAARAREMAEGGVLEEARSLMERGVDPALPSMSGHGYKHWARHLRGEVDLETAIAATARDVRAYSRRQMTWLRRDPEIRWVDPEAEDPLPLVAELLRGADAREPARA